FSSSLNPRVLRPSRPSQCGEWRNSTYKDAVGYRTYLQRTSSRARRDTNITTLADVQHGSHDWRRSVPPCRKDSARSEQRTGRHNVLRHGYFGGAFAAGWKE